MTKEIKQHKNHSWDGNTCLRCGIKRVRRYWRLLMAITDFPPYNHYQSGVDWYYGEKHKFNRPDCN